MSMINYPAFFVTLATIFLLVVHTLAQSTLFPIAFVVLLPLGITVGLFKYLEGRLPQDQESSTYGE